MGDVRWLTAFVDLPAAHWRAGTEFWLQVTGARLSAARGDAEQFATLLPPDGDAYLRVQRTGAPARIHLDLHVDDVEAVAVRAERLGAARLHTDGHVVLASPGGFVFCIVRHRGEAVRPSSHGGALVDQVCLDIPAAGHDAECAFWAALTGWEHRPETPAEFTELARPHGIPLRILLQRLGEPDGQVRAHLDLAAGAQRDEVVERHVALGARVEARRRGWVVLTDPAGLPYCVTARDTVTGL
ncbi:hypothetical protein OEB99_14080 [Actinotalea sp. M2MS4P-6]|uniref:VOC family protein n=1 Tax=Actinotalea sp. M2MS4P-6 TaxID=2983762 RepID=UPI0021E3CB6A|nr:VOC family protein [Actinotalea sp. M2MS4P-6]MCV2395441.1 hypothetical protein [Actinotalea sp. M2MS4P-6]